MREFKQKHQTQEQAAANWYTLLGRLDYAPDTDALDIHDMINALHRRLAAKGIPK